LKQARERWVKVDEEEKGTDSRQLKKLDNERVMPKLIRVASRLALLNRNVTMRTGTRKCPPTM
jgi:hypothetical protein